MIYIGIDPGAKGGIAYIDGDKHFVIPYSSEGLIEIMTFLDLESQAKMCCLEEVHAMPKQGVVSTFNFGVNFGYIKGVLDAVGIPYQLVPPKRWKSEYGLNSDKKKSVEVCRRLFPEVSLKMSIRGRTDSDGMAEALLMAEYARRRL